MLRKMFILSICLMLGACSSFKHPDINLITPVCIKPYSGYRYKTCEEIIFTINQTYYYIPKNFETDLATIPRLMWPFVSPAYSGLLAPAVVHDWFYRMSCDFNRLEADIIFYQMLLDNKINKINASMLYYSVRSFGRFYYNEDYCE